MSNIFKIELAKDDLNQALNTWISYLKNNPKEIISASSQATKAVEYMLNKK